MKIIRLKSLLCEVHMEELYHATYSSELLSILKDNAIKLTFAAGTDSDLELNRGYFYFLSTMRSKYGNYPRRGTGSNRSVAQNVVINLNGRKLTNSGFKIFPIDYWWNDPAMSEQEERIASNNDEISPLNKFVNSIHVYIDTDIKHPFELERLLEINKLAQHYIVPIYFYSKGNELYFMSQRIEKSVRDIRNLIDEPEWTEADLEFKQYRSKHNLGKFEEKYLRTLLDIYYETSIDINKQPAKTIMNWILYYPRDLHIQIKNSIHIAKRFHLSIFRELVKAIKDSGSKSLDQFLDFLTEREREKIKK